MENALRGIHGGQDFSLRVSRENPPPSPPRNYMYIDYDGHVS